MYFGSVDITGERGCNWTQKYHILGVALPSVIRPPYKHIYSHHIFSPVTFFAPLPIIWPMRCGLWCHSGVSLSPPLLVLVSKFQEAIPQGTKKKKMTMEYKYTIYRAHRSKDISAKLLQTLHLLHHRASWSFWSTSPEGFLKILSKGG